MIFLTETKCEIRFIYVRFNCKRKKGGSKMGGQKCQAFEDIAGGSPLSHFTKEICKEVYCDAS